MEKCPKHRWVGKRTKKKHEKFWFCERMPGKSVALRHAGTRCQPNPMADPIASTFARTLSHKLYGRDRRSLKYQSMQTFIFLRVTASTNLLRLASEQQITIRCAWCMKSIIESSKLLSSEWRVWRKGLSRHYRDGGKYQGKWNQVWWEHSAWCSFMTSGGKIHHIF